MHQEFADWYRLVNAEPTNEVLESRWTAVESLCEADEDPLNMVRIAFSLPPHPDGFLATFQAAFQKGDKAFRIRNNELEHAVLASAAIANLLETAAPADKVFVALAVLCMEFRGHRQTEATKRVGIADRARNCLKQLSAGLRRDLGSKSSTEIAWDDAGALKKVEEHANQNQPIPAVKELTGVVQHAATVIGEICEAMKQADRRHRLYEEELDMLWWLTNGSTRDQQLRFDAMSPGALAVVAGSDLADLTRVEPGPLAIPALITQSLRAAKAKPEEKDSIQSIISATDHAWRQRFLRCLEWPGLDVFCAVHSGLREAAKSNKWQDAFAHVTGLNPKQETMLLDVALQTYHERLLMRLAGRRQEDA